MIVLRQYCDINRDMLATLITTFTDAINYNLCYFLSVLCDLRGERLSVCLILGKGRFIAFGDFANSGIFPKCNGFKYKTLIILKN